MPSDNHHVVKRLIQEWDECGRLDQHAQNHDLLGQSWIPFFFLTLYPLIVSLYRVNNLIHPHCGGEEVSWLERVGVFMNVRR